MREPCRYKPGVGRAEIDPARCRAAVFGTRVSYWQCGHKPLAGKEWCLVHDPEHAEKRLARVDRKRTERYETYLAQRTQCSCKQCAAHRERAVAKAMRAVKRKLGALDET